MLRILETHRVLRLTRPGRLQPWLGPALRGLAARRFKADVCRYPPAIQETERRYCKGCPLMAGCAYGETVEPDAPPHVHVPAGLEDAARPLVIAAAFPLPEEGRLRLRIPLRVTFIGATAAGHAEAFWQALAAAGRERGLDPERTTFAVEPDPRHPAEVWSEMILRPDPRLKPATIKVELTSPLVLREEGETGKRLVTEPTFSDLLRASLRTLGPLCRLYGEPQPDEVFRPMKELAATVPTVRSVFREYRQPSWSNRREQHREIVGVVGEAEYGPVPPELLPWLRWGGRVHVGGHRVAGAGSWRATPIAP